MLPIRITFAGCSTRLARSPSDTSSESPPCCCSTEAGTAPTGWPSGPTMTTWPAWLGWLGSSPPVGSGCWLMSPTLASPGSGDRQQDLARAVARLHQRVRTAGIGQRHPRTHDRPDRAVRDERPDVLHDRGADRGLLLQGSRPQGGGDHRTALAHQGAEVELALGATLHPDHHEPPLGGQRLDVAGQVRRAHVVEDDVGALPVSRAPYL